MSLAVRVSASKVTFSKRRQGMIKKAYELHKLCGVEIALIMIDGKNRLYE